MGMIELGKMAHMFKALTPDGRPMPRQDLIMFLAYAQLEAARHGQKIGDANSYNVRGTFVKEDLCYVCTDKSELRTSVITHFLPHSGRPTGIDTEWLWLPHIFEEAYDCGLFMSCPDSYGVLTFDREDVVPDIGDGYYRFTQFPATSPLRIRNFEEWVQQGGSHSTLVVRDEMARAGVFRVDPGLTIQPNIGWSSTGFSKLLTHFIDMVENGVEERPAWLTRVNLDGIGRNSVPILSLIHI